MGQLSNVITLRKSNPLNLFCIEKETFLYTFRFLEQLKRSLAIKGIYLIQKNSALLGNSSILYLDIFFGSKKISKYKLKIFTPSNKRGLKKKVGGRINFFLNNQFIAFKNSLSTFFFTNLNTKIENKLLGQIYFKTKRFIFSLFVRRFPLFLDFIKLATLFIMKRVGVDIFLLLLAKIFKNLQKKGHAKFFFFLTYFFSIILSLKQKPIKGIKFIASGRIRGKPRSSSTKVSIGSVSNQSLNQKISFGKCHVYTLYGVFGFKVWVNYF